VDKRYSSGRMICALALGERNLAISAHEDDAIENAKHKRFAILDTRAIAFPICAGCE
jgi:hypothetical protein